MKKLLFSLALVIGVIGLSSQNLSDGLLLHYDFSGNANDISGNNRHATVYAATLTNDRNGNANSAYYFDGVDDYIELPNDNELKPPLPLTIAFWVRFDDISTTYRSLVLDTDFFEDRYTGVWIHAYDGYLTLNFGDGTPNSTDPVNRRSKTGSTKLSENVWYHVVGIIRGTGDMAIYINCANDGGTYNGTGGALVYSTNSGVIGKIDTNVDKPPRFLKGALDDIRYWNRALTEDEVELFCESTLAIKEDKKEGLLKSVHPNPSNGDFTLLLNSDKSLNIELYDITGKIILQVKDYRGSELKINNLNQGMYFVKVQNDTTQTTQKIIVNKN